MVVVVVVMIFIYIKIFDMKRWRDMAGEAGRGNGT
jgi:hypothetical protein